MSSKMPRRSIPFDNKIKWFLKEFHLSNRFIFLNLSFNIRQGFAPIAIQAALHAFSEQQIIVQVAKQGSTSTLVTQRLRVEIVS